MRCGAAAVRCGTGSNRAHCRPEPSMVRVVVAAAAAARRRWRRVGGRWGPRWIPRAARSSPHCPDFDGLWGQRAITSHRGQSRSRVQPAAAHQQPSANNSRPACHHPPRFPRTPVGPSSRGGVATTSSSPPSPLPLPQQHHSPHLRMPSLFFSPTGGKKILSSPPSPPHWRSWPCSSCHLRRLDRSKARRRCPPGGGGARARRELWHTMRRDRAFQNKGRGAIRHLHRVGRNATFPRQPARLSLARSEETRSQPAANLPNLRAYFTWTTT